MDNTHIFTVKSVNVCVEMLLGAFNNVFIWSKIGVIGKMDEEKRFTDFELSQNSINEFSFLSCFR